MALSQLQAGYQVTIIAQDDAAQAYWLEGLQIIPLGIFSRLSPARWTSKRKIKSALLALRPDFLQVHTVELLSLAADLKAKLPGLKVVFDMHEDYVKNILYADYYASGLRSLLAARVKAVQDRFPLWGDGLLLAEDCFEDLIEMPASRQAIARNKYVEADSTDGESVQGPQGLPFLLHTGTIARNWGVFEALALWKAMNQVQPMGLVIVGHGQNADELHEIDQIVAASGFADRFRLVGGAEYAPYELVRKYILACTFGMALYVLKENLKDRRPTKFYEYMALQKPLIFTTQPTWDAMNEAHPFGLSVAASASPSEKAQAVFAFWKSDAFSKAKRLPASVWSWESEATEMLRLYERLTHSPA